MELSKRCGDGRFTKYNSYSRVYCAYSATLDTASTQSMNSTRPRHSSSTGSIQESNPKILQVHGVTTVSNPEILQVWNYPKVSRLEMLGLLAVLAVSKPDILRVLEVPRVFIFQKYYTVLSGSGNICATIYLVGVSLRLLLP